MGASSCGSTLTNRAKIPQKDACGCYVRIFAPTFQGFSAGGFALGMLWAVVSCVGQFRTFRWGLHRAAAR